MKDMTSNQIALEIIDILNNAMATGDKDRAYERLDALALRIFKDDGTKEALTLKEALYF